MAGFDIDVFRAKVGEGVLRNNKFLVTVDRLPNGMAGSPLAAAYRQAAEGFYCEASDFPGVTMMTHEHRHLGYGPTMKKPYAPLFSDIALVYRGDPRGEIFRFLRGWAMAAVNYEYDSPERVPNLESYEVGYYDDSVTQVSFTSYADDGTEAERLVIQDAYPIRIAEMPMAWTSTGTYAQLAVQLAFSRFQFGDSAPA